MILDYSTNSGAYFICKMKKTTPQKKNKRCWKDGFLRTSDESKKERERATKTYLHFICNSYKLRSEEEKEKQQNKHEAYAWYGAVYGKASNLICFSSGLYIYFSS